MFSIVNWDSAAKWLPSNLSQGMLITNDPTAGQNVADSGSPYFTWWVCALLLAAYGLVLSGVGSWLTTRRDIT